MLGRRSQVKKSWERAGAKWCWTTDGRLKMRTTTTVIHDADILPFRGLSMPEKPKPFYALTEKDRKIYSVFANMSDDEFREAQAVVAGIPAPGTGPFAKTAAAFVAACSTPEFRTSMAAHQILEAASAARGDGAELSSRLSGPDQTPGPTATAGGIVRAGKQRRGEV